MGADAEKGADALPRDAHATGSVQPLRQPGSRGRVEWALVVDREEQDVGVDEHQRNAGPSSCSIASATLLTSIRSPSDFDRCRNARRGGVALSPRRIRSLIAS